jgi:dienelactone hydrolase
MAKIRYKSGRLGSAAILVAETEAPDSEGSDDDMNAIKNKATNTHSTLGNRCFYSIFAVWLCCTAASGAVLAQDRMRFESVDGTDISALVIEPASAARGTVVAMHGCGGLFAQSGPRKGQLNDRHQAMGELLAGWGFRAMFPDSLTPRGETELCTQKLGERKIDQRQRRADALGALAWAKARFGPAHKTAILGWSHGGSAVLAATDAKHRVVQAQADRFDLAVAFYPGCSAPLGAGYSPNAPLVLMLGEKDDWTPPGPCIELGQRVGAQVHVFADAFHDFDNPSGRLRVRSDVPNGINPGQGVTVGPNSAAREQAYKVLKEKLDEMAKTP